MDKLGIMARETTQVVVENTQQRYDSDSKTGSETMKLLHKIETTVAGWLKGVPHLPAAGQKWLATNIWWLALIAAILTGISLLVAVTGLFSLLAIVGTYVATYYVSEAVSAWAIITTLISIAFMAVSVVLLAMAITPLKELKKKGWVLLFMVWLLEVVSVVVSAVLTLNVAAAIISLLFGGIFLAIIGYFLFEIHGQFALPKKATKKSANKAK